MINAERIASDCRIVTDVLSRTPAIDKQKCIQRGEFEARASKVYAALAARNMEVGLVFSDAHYCGDVPYLGGNTNITVEQVAGVVGRTGFHIVAGLEGGYVAEQLASRAGVCVHKAELLQLADEVYPVEAESLADILRAANGGATPKTIALLSPRQVIPASLVGHCEGLVGQKNLIDAQELYYRIKYEKSEDELGLIEDAAVICDAAMEAMLRVLKPGMLETQVAAWGYFVARELGAEELGFDIMVGANEANRSLIGKALNRAIKQGDWVHLGVGCKRDGLNACIRRSVIAAPSPKQVEAGTQYWFDFLENAYQAGFAAYLDIAKTGAPAKKQEQALVDYFASRSAEVSARIGKQIALEKFKPYTGTHNSGYTECQEFFGAITLQSEEPLGRNIVTMLDVALRGIGSHWEDVALPGLDYIVMENTLVKRGSAVKCCNRLQLNVQALVAFPGA